MILVPVNAPFKGGTFATMANAYQSALLFKHELDNSSQVLASGIAYQPFGNPGWISIGFQDQSGNYRQANHNIVDFDFFETMGLEMVDGRSFDEQISSDANTALVVNEAAVRYFGWENPLEARLEGGRFPNHQIIGVVKDFNYQSLYGDIEPLILSVNPELVLRGAGDVMISSAIAPVLHVKVAGQRLTESLDRLEDTWKRVFPHEPFTFDFLDDQLKNQYRQEESMRTIVSYSSFLAILVGSLGLFGLVTLAVNTRIKEIGIRKVLGASTGQLFYLLSRDYVMMILVALMISVPFSLYFIEDWLSTFAYRISIPVEVFVLAGMGVALVSFATISFQVFKASRTQPVTTLKYE